MNKTPETIWARVKPTAVLDGLNREVGESREWCEGYLTPEIAKTCGAIEYTRTDHAQALIAAAERRGMKRDEARADLEKRIAAHAASCGPKQFYDKGRKQGRQDAMLGYAVFGAVSGLVVALLLRGLVA